MPCVCYALYVCMRSLLLANHGVLEAALGRVRATWQPRQSVCRSARVVQGNAGDLLGFRLGWPGRFATREKVWETFHENLS